VSSGTFYFVGEMAPAGSLSSTGQGQPVVYLRWDVIEGQLPADIAGFVLYKDGSPLADFPAIGVMPADEIEAMYAAPSQERRRLESLTALKKLALQDDAVDDFDASDFPAALAARLAADITYASLASRADINIARARYRAFVNTEITARSHDYELRARHVDGREARVGRVTVDTTTPGQVLPARDFRQVEQGSCDALEHQRDHHSVALSWRAPSSTSAADALASNVFIAGYDLYRSTDNVPASMTDAPVRSLATEAAGRGHDSTGTVRFDGLEKVNEVLLTIDGAQGDEPVFLETQDELLAADVRAGDRRAYYLVARDFAGQYGPTSGAIVLVDDLARPPAPWDVRAYADTGAAPGHMELAWDDITYDSFVETFLGGDQICNPLEARQTNRLEIVGPTANCNTDPRRAVSVDVADYRVYRFETFEQASAFKDSDGDGYSDTDERRLIAAGQLAAGAQCDADKPAFGPDSVLAKNAKLSRELIGDGQRPEIRLIDETPAADPGVVYWYRIASVTNGSRASLLSAPVRAIFPQRLAPEPPTVGFETDSDENCDCRLDVVNATTAWTLRDGIQTGRRLGVACGNSTNLPPPTQTFAVREADASTDTLCRLVTQQGLCDGFFTLQYQIQPPDKGVDARYCNMPVGDGARFCDSGDVAIVRDGCDRRAAEPGESVPGAVYVNVEFPPGTCGSLFRQIAGRNTRVATSCGTDTPEVIDGYELDAGVGCFHAVTQDEHNNLSASSFAGCIAAGGQQFAAPSTPQPVALEFADTRATARWKLSPEPVTVTMVELTRERDSADGGTVVRAVPNAGGAITTDVLSQGLDIPQLLADADDAGERWCLRLRAIGPSAEGVDAPVSPWSAPLCSERSDSFVAPEYLPWPVVEQAPEGDALALLQGIDLNPTDLEEQTAVLIPLAPAFRGVSISACNLAEILGFNEKPRSEGAFIEPACSLAESSELRAALGNVLDFVVYRQARGPDGAIGDWMEVSPLIDRLHFDRIGGVRADPIDVLADPFIKLIEDPDFNGGFQLAYYDRQTRLVGYDYRYQIVYFTADNRIRQWRQTPWLESESSSGQAAASTGGAS
ncbi:hypothetical protein, partial [uncultured Abyssibacter sp.]|uniref:hypothetical protein n=1 Tax=uncultured Abyssibacter sp. TaxID=2320202 RepID=UPI0032B270F3